MGHLHKMVDTLPGARLSLLDSLPPPGHFGKTRVILHARLTVNHLIQPLLLPMIELNLKREFSVQP